MPLLTNWLESLSYELTAADHCLRKINSFSTCTACQESCEKNAIIVGEYGIQIVKDICDGCGLCIPSCPVQALEGQSPNRITINQTLILDESLQPTKYELLYFYKRGLRTISAPGMDGKLEKIIAKTNEVLGRIGKDPFRIVKELEPVPEEQVRLSRRDFFSKLYFDSKKLALSTVTPAKWRFDQDKFKRPGMFEGWALFKVKLDPEKCTLCEACFRLCPGKAFTVKDSMLKIDYSKCSGCSLCMDICRKKAVQIGTDVQPSVILEITILHLNCKKCFCDYLGWEEADTCPICETAGQHSLL
jgi:ferredoxin